MPILKVFEDPQLLASLAAGVGQFEQRQAEDAMGLRHAQLGLSAQGQQMQGYGMILGDLRSRDANAMAYDRSLEVAGINQGGRFANTAAQQEGAAARNAASIQSREGIAGANRQATGDRQVLGIENQAERQRAGNEAAMERLRTGSDLRGSQQQAARQARAEAQTERYGHMQAVAEERAKARTEAVAGRQQVAAQRMMRADAIRQLMDEQDQLDEWMRQDDSMGRSDPAKVQRFMEITAQLRRLNPMAAPMGGAMPQGNPNAQPGPVAPNGFEPSPFAPATQPATQPATGPIGAPPMPSFGDPYGGAATDPNADPMLAQKPVGTVARDPAGRRWQKTPQGWITL